jgi:hypothetical protein
MSALSPYSSATRERVSHSPHILPVRARHAKGRLGKADDDDNVKTQSDLASCGEVVVHFELADFGWRERELSGDRTDGLGDETVSRVA